MKRIIFKRRFLNHIKNDEYQNLIKTIFKRLDDEAIEETHITNVVNNAKRHLDGITDIATKTNFHGNTQLIAQLGEERRKMIMGLNYAIKSDLYAETKEKREAARLVYIWIRHERKLISMPRVEGQTGMVNRLQADLQKDPKLREALKVIHADKRFEKIVSMTKEIEGMFIERNHDIKTKPINMKLPRKKCNEDLQTMFEALAGMANTEGAHRVKYHNLCLEIQGLMIRTESKMILRKTLKAKEKENNPDVADTPEENTASEATTISNDENTEPGIEYTPDSNDPPNSDDLIITDISADGTNTELNSELIPIPKPLISLEDVSQMN